MRSLLATALALVLLGLVPGAAPAAAVTAAAPPPWSWPTDPPHIVQRQYLAPATLYGAGHRGLDIAASTSVLRAPADGVVHFAGIVVDRPVLSIAHAGSLLSSYEPVTTTLVAGDSVSRGQVIGVIGPGHCQEQLCVHFGVRLDGQYVSPLLLVGGIPRSVLLPTR